MQKTCIVFYMVGASWNVRRMTYNIYIYIYIYIYILYIVSYAAVSDSHSRQICHFLPNNEKFVDLN